jgi:peptidoglycan hydrolase CwlO-like protein
VGLPSRKTRTALLQKTEEELEQARAKVNEMRQAVSSALRSYEELEPHVADAKGGVERVSRQLHAAKGTIQELENSANDSLAILGQRVSKVHQMVRSL